jgi:hypothetical protein
MFSLLNRGIIPRDVDLTPAFERGNAPFVNKAVAIENSGVKRPPQLSKEVSNPMSRRK